MKREPEFADDDDDGDIGSRLLLALNAYRTPAETPYLTSEQFLDAISSHDGKVRKALADAPWRQSPMSGCELSEFQSHYYFFLCGHLVAQGIDWDTASRLAANETLIATNDAVGINQTAGHA